MRHLTARSLAGGLLAAFLAACSETATAPPAPASPRAAPVGAAFEQALVGPTAYLAEVVSAAQGKQKNGGPVLAERSNPASALGPSDDDFFSLGFGGVLVAKFDRAYSGTLLISFEQTIVPAYPIEKAAVEISADGVTYTPIGTISNVNDPGSDVRPFAIPLPAGACVRFVRITDTTDPALHNPTADGFDVNAIAIDQAVACAPPAGCSHGYFKNHATPNEGRTFASYGIVGSGRQTSTLKSALSFKGGSSLQDAKDNLLKQLAASLLNTAYVNGFPLTTAQVVAKANAALATNNRATILALASELDKLNNLGCTLD